MEPLFPISKVHWIVRIKGARKEHITAQNEFGEPDSTTLCKRACAPDDRTRAVKATSAKGTECRTCLRVIEKALADTRALFVRMGKTHKEARQLTKQLFDLHEE
jgi:hypothetical protein